MESAFRTLEVVEMSILGKEDGNELATKCKWIYMFIRMYVYNEKKGIIIIMRSIIFITAP